MLNAYEYSLFSLIRRKIMKKNKLRKLLLWIIIPAVVSFFAGAWFTFHGVSNLGITILVAIVGTCATDAYFKKSAKIALLVANWSAEVVTGFLYIKVLAGFLGEFGLMMHLLIILLFLITLLLTINYGEYIMKVTE